MKRKLIFIFLFFITLFLGGCNTSVTNEIYNKSYNSTIDLQEFEDLIVAATEKVSPAVLGVSSYEQSFLDKTLVGTGSGVVYECSALYKDGTIENDCSKTLDRQDVETYRYYLVTNRHVVTSDKGAPNTIRVYDGEADRQIDADLIQFDDRIDIAVVYFEYSKYIQPIEFGDSNNVKKGEFAIAIGNPAGYEYYGSATFGIISYPKRYMSDDTDSDGVNDWDAEYVQHDVAINPGNSGGALINIKGQLIGINTLKLVDSEIDNMGFAIPSSVVKELVSILQTGKKPVRYKLGINVYTVRDILFSEGQFNDKDHKPISIPEEIEYGIFVIDLADNAIAEGFLEPGDIILEVNGDKVKYSHEFRANLGEITKGDVATFKIFRNDQIIDINIPFN